MSIIGLSIILSFILSLSISIFLSVFVAKKHYKWAYIILFVFVFLGLSFYFIKDIKHFIVQPSNYAGFFWWALPSIPFILLVCGLLMKKNFLDNWRYSISTFFGCIIFIIAETIFSTFIAYIFPRHGWFAKGGGDFLFLIAIGSPVIASILLVVFVSLIITDLDNQKKHSV